ncbi:MAG: hypothetical protein VZS44_09560 [Bacilli bacterium]|nr:hypothetical protein [Bacilli bacterium]
MNNLLPISYSYTDVLTSGELSDDMLWDYCASIYHKMDCSSPDEVLQDLLCVEYFPDVTFHTLLERYLEEQGKDIDDVVRGYAPHKKGFLMTHGYGYSWQDSDLLGGSGDGKEFNKFEEWLEKQGYCLS